MVTTTNNKKEEQQQPDSRLGLWLVRRRGPSESSVGSHRRSANK